VRANVGIAKGEFRYFETHRLGPIDNFGQGIITADGMIDPYCCFVESTQPGFPYSGTPKSVTINSIGGVFRNLDNLVPTFTPAQSDLGAWLNATEYYGFAVDYTGTNPVVYLVITSGTGNILTVSDGIPVAGFGGGPVMPMMHGHPISETAPSLTMNLGLQKFHYDPTAVKNALQTSGVNVTKFSAGVGAHTWK
jgi:hypothetical protein